MPLFISSSVEIRNWRLEDGSPKLEFGTAPTGRKNIAKGSALGIAAKP